LRGVVCGASAAERKVGGILARETMGKFDIAVIGAGVSGLTAAAVLGAAHRVTVFEAAHYAGGHSHTHEVFRWGRTWPVDSGFIVYNKKAYPNFVRLLEKLNVRSQPAPMTFAVRCETTGLEYGGASLNALFAQRRNLLRPRFWRLVRDVLRFGTEARELLAPGDETQSLRAYLEERRYSRQFIEQYAIPIGASIWSAPPSAIADFPARHFVRFFDHHGVLDPRRAPQWWTVAGGSQRYVARLIEPFAERIRLGTSALGVRRREGKVEVATLAGGVALFDRVVLAVHSDQALALLTSPTREEREVLGAIPYQENEAVLHHDASLLPRCRRAWSSWNYHVPRAPADCVTLTYNMSILQSLGTPDPLCVSLNPQRRIAPQKLIERMVYHHPQYSPAAVAAQGRHDDIDGKGGVHFCGAYWGYGFHEDGVESALRVTRKFGLGLESVR
jgi:uncharacterized protein